MQSKIYGGGDLHVRKRFVIQYDISLYYYGYTRMRGSLSKEDRCNANLLNRIKIQKDKGLPRGKGEEAFFVYGRREASAFWA